MLLNERSIDKLERDVELMFDHYISYQRGRCYLVVFALASSQHVTPGLSKKQEVSGLSTCAATLEQ